MLKFFSHNNLKDAKDFKAIRNRRQIKRESHRLYCTTVYFTNGMPLS